MRDAGEQRPGPGGCRRSFFLAALPVPFELWVGPAAWRLCRRPPKAEGRGMVRERSGNEHPARSSPPRRNQTASEPCLPGPTRPVHPNPAPIRSFGAARMTWLPDTSTIPPDIAGMVPLPDKLEQLGFARKTDTCPKPPVGRGSSDPAGVSSCTNQSREERTAWGGSVKRTTRTALEARHAGRPARAHSVAAGHAHPMRHTQRRRFIILKSARSAPGIRRWPQGGEGVGGGDARSEARTEGLADPGGGGAEQKGLAGGGMDARGGTEWNPGRRARSAARVDAGGLWVQIIAAATN